jgi:hypothetical protein
MSTVLQPWVEGMPWKCQSILFSGLRGPDTGLCPRVKEVSRWMRKVSQEDADPSQSYMAPTALPQPEELEKELEFTTSHFVHHFADALRCISLWHPDGSVSAYAKSVHHYIADELFHFVPESDAEFIHRHRDRTQHA